MAKLTQNFKAFTGTLSRSTSRDMSSPNQQTSIPKTNPSTTFTMGSQNVVDITSLIENYAWDHFLDIQAATRKNEHKGIERDDVHFEVNLKQLLIEHTEPEYRNFHPTSSKPWSLFKTVFTNNCSRAQEYSFRTERSTESICSIFRENGYAFGVEAQLSLKTPMEILQANAGFKREIHFTKATENTVSELLTWGVDSNIVVPGRHQTTAELVVEEMSYAGHFSLISHLSGRVTVSIIRRRDSTLMMPLTLHIAELFRDAISTKHGAALKAMCTVDKNAVKLITKGNCQFQFAMKQRVEVNEEPLMTDKEVQTTQTTPI